MRTRSLTSLALLLSFSIISVPTIRPQTKEKPKNPGESFVSHKDRDSQKEKEDEWSRREPRDGEEWFARGYQLHSSDRYPEAIEAFKRAADLGYRKPISMYNIACGYSLLNDKEEALAWLGRARENGFSRTDLLSNDSDLDPLRSDPRFKTLLASIPAKPDRLERANLEFARLEREKSADGDEWARAGLRLLQLRVLDRAIVALNQAVAHLNDKGSTAMYNLACAYALKGDRAAGIQWLERAVNAGFDSPEKLRNDPDITSLRSDSRFSRIEKLSNTLSLSQFHEKAVGADDSDNYRYSRQRWAPAIDLYESFIKSEPGNGRAWFNLGYALHYSREHARAIGAFEHARQLGYHKATSIYNIACAYAMLNQKDSAFEWLDRAIEAGFDSYGYLGWDRDLDNLRSDPRFKRFSDRAGYSTKMKTKEAR